MAESPADLRSDEPPLILFDGVCNLCNASVRWIIEKDPRRIFRFASLQSAAGRAALAASGTTVPPLESVVLIDRTGAHTRSDAAIRIARRLGLPWSAVALALLVPRRLRDAVYAWVAGNRYRWFGRRESCLRPTPELAGLFLDAGEPSEALRVQDPPPEATAKPVGLGGFLFGFANRFVLALFFLTDLSRSRSGSSRASIDGWRSSPTSSGRPLYGWVGWCSGCRSRFSRPAAATRPTTTSSCSSTRVSPWSSR